MKRWLTTICTIALLVSPPVSAQSTFEAAVRAYQSKNYASALEQLKTLHARNRSDPMIHYYMALCYHGLNSMRDAVREYGWVAENTRDPRLKANALAGLQQIGRSTARLATTGTVRREPSSSPSSSSSVPSTSSAPSQPIAAPVVQNGLFQPTYILRDGRSTTAGKAWCAKTRSGLDVLITVLHALGPAGGLAEQVPPDQVSNVLSRVDLLRLPSGESAGSTNIVLSKSGNVSDHSGDIMIFRAPASLSGDAFQIAEKPPTVGQRCWFHTSLVDGEGSVESFPGIVRESSAKSFVLKLDKSVDTRVTSGSPILDQNGQVVGMSWGHTPSGAIACIPGSAINSMIASDVR